jgi:hypothetical protein
LVVADVAASTTVRTVGVVADVAVAVDAAVTVVAAAAVVAVEVARPKARRSGFPSPSLVAW